VHNAAHYYNKEFYMKNLFMPSKCFAGMERVAAAWGVSDTDKMVGIRLILRGADPDRVVEAIQQVRDGLGAMQCIQDNLTVMENG
jgi:hypothetical protein